MKQEIFQYVGSMQQVAYVRSVRFEEGQASEMKAKQVKNGELMFTVMEDKCLDIAELSYKGLQMNFLAKQGLQGPVFGKSENQIQSIMGGLFFTAGFETIGSGFEKSGKQYPLHGSMRLMPAEHVCGKAAWENGRYCLSVEGEVRHGSLFGENMVLRRKIRTELGRREIVITDEIENESAESACWMQLYHFNIGYPFLHERGEVVMPSKTVSDRDAHNYEPAANWRRIGKPVVGVPESVYIHELAADEKGETFAAYINPDLELGMKLRFQKEILPWLMEWKSLRAGDYALGLEPSNAHIARRLYHEAKGSLPSLPPFGKAEIVLTLEILEGREELEEIKREASRLTGGEHG